MKLTKLFNEFFESEKTSGFILIACTVISLILANSRFGSDYVNLFHLKFAGLTLEHWINDGLMAIFFLLIGLELEREIYKGELSNIKDALLPFFGAIGGLLFPAVIYLIFNYGTETQSGVGIPMATDIAFALGVLSLLGSKVPASLKVFLTALAVIDDLAAIILIAIFYTKTVVLLNLLIAIGIFALLLLINKLGVRGLHCYIIGGVIMWYFMLHSGVHPTIAGVLLAFAIPFDLDDEKSPSYALQHFLHKPVAFIVLPIFALANTAIVLSGEIERNFIQNYVVGIALGLIVGKPLGIFTSTFLSVKFGICKLPEELSWKTIFGAGILGGIGFTMSIFITLLAFSEPTIVNTAKLTILSSSTIAGLFGFVFLNRVLRSDR
ncbi:MAG: Na+/H+ antiporter NhaA [Candidatus Kryptonium sp.]|nr:Na+/H+ antiporter NhaA [Candidatus Kryptonium sp.]MCX7907160.1 Na+/H+ antiporter NhaA [Bacteroidota bacterium]MDW8109236.1 Na+/H+ antiporter NhaA [Candidatus Kryptonium sp.]